MSELAKTMLDEEDEQLLAQEVPVLDDMDAEYMLEQYKQAEAQFQKMEAWYTYKLQQNKELWERTKAWVESSLRPYLDTVPAKITKTQMTYELPGGKLILKKQEPQYDTQDEQLVPWLKQNGMADMVKVKESSKWAELKKVLKVSPDGTGMMTADGEVVPGITVTARDDKFTITTK